jgi:hypothetical protein
MNLNYLAALLGLSWNLLRFDVAVVRTMEQEDGLLRTFIEPMKIRRILWRTNAYYNRC